MVVWKVCVPYEEISLVDAVSLGECEFDGDYRCVVYRYDSDLIEELESRGIKFVVVELW